MPNQPSPILTDNELQIMAVVWKRGDATVGQIRDHVRELREVKYNAIGGAITVMVSLRVEGSDSPAYEVVIDKAAAHAATVQQLSDLNHGGSREALLKDISETEASDRGKS